VVSLSQVGFSEQQGKDMQSKTWTKAAGAYLRRLREAKGLGRPTVANMILTSENQVKRIEDGDIDTRGSLMLAFCRAVGGNPADLERLQGHGDRHEEEGREMANECIRVQGDLANVLRSNGFIHPDNLADTRFLDYLLQLVQGDQVVHTSDGGEQSVSANSAPSRVRQR